MLKRCEPLKQAMRLKLERVIKRLKEKTPWTHPTNN